MTILCYLALLLYDTNVSVNVFKVEIYALKLIKNQHWFVFMLPEM